MVNASANEESGLAGCTTRRALRVRVPSCSPIYDNPLPRMRLADVQPRKLSRVQPVPALQRRTSRRLRFSIKQIAFSSVNREIQWRCKTDHPNCEARDWRPYKTSTEAEAERFIRDIAPNSKNFVYRIKPGENPEAIQKGQPG